MTAEDIAVPSPLHDRANLASPSTQALLAHQVASGAFVASHDFAPYRYCWLRDGSFIAYALDRAGERDAAEGYHRWVASAIAGIAPVMRAATERRMAGTPNEISSMPPARFDLDGTVLADDWPNFQVDGYGTWVWSLSQHTQRWGAGKLADELAEAVELTAAYLEAVGLDACYDCWEENSEAVHTSTLACVHGGLVAAASLTGRQSASHMAEQVAERIVADMSEAGRFAKSSTDRGVDASLLWLAVPFGVMSPTDAAMAATASQIATVLDLQGGTRRYPADTYYGGGAWPLLTAWLGWYYALAGDLGAAEQCIGWVSERIDAQGCLPEQVGGDERDPEAYDEWVARWGPPAADLAWSQAMYLVLSDELSGLEAAPLRRSLSG
jgi:GH15 family glucan-1,4-alpha-glucosidase